MFVIRGKLSEVCLLSEVSLSLLLHGMLKADWIGKPKSVNDNNKKDTSSLQSINLAKYSCTTATDMKQTFQYYQHHIYNEFEPYFPIEPTY